MHSFKCNKSAVTWGKNRKHVHHIHFYWISKSIVKLPWPIYRPQQTPQLRPSTSILAFKRQMKKRLNVEKISFWRFYSTLMGRQTHGENGVFDKWTWRQTQCLFRIHWNFRMNFSSLSLPQIKCKRKRWKKMCIFVVPCVLIHNFRSPEKFRNFVLKFRKTCWNSAKTCWVNTHYQV